MVDCRGVTGAPPQEHSQSAPNGAPAAETHLSQTGGSGGDAGAHSLSSAASTPPSTSSVVTYSGVAGGVGPPYGAAAGGPCTPYACGGVKAVMWCAPHSPPPAPGPAPAGVPVPVPVQHVPHILPPPLGVNPHVYKSVQPSGADLPMNDIPTLRYYFNLGVECMWTVYGPPFPHAPPHHYSPRDLAQDMQSMSMHDRSGMNQSNAPDQNHKHKPSQGNDKSSINNQGKMNGQRPLLGPRFKRGGGNQDGNMNSNHQNKIHNNMGNKGPNHRRNPHAEGRSYGGGGGGGGGGGSAGSGGGGGGGYGGGGGGEGECMVEQPLISLPYIPYTAGPAPPVYPIQYYPVEADPGMIGMMGGNGMGYLSYEESVEYGAMQQYYGGHHHYPPPPLPPHHHHHHYQPPPPPPPHHGPHHHQQQHHMEPK